MLGRMETTLSSPPSLCLCISYPLAPEQTNWLRFLGSGEVYTHGWLPGRLWKKLGIGRLLRVVLLDFRNHDMQGAPAIYTLCCGQRLAESQVLTQMAVVNGAPSLFDLAIQIAHNALLV